MTFGDAIGIPLIINAFVHLVVKDLANLWWSLPIMIVGAGIFAKMCLGKEHKPDYGFPEVGKISLAGMLHLIYFGAGIGATIISLCNLFTGELVGPVLYVALGGGVAYLAFLAPEIMSGNFDPLKRVSLGQISSEESLTNQ